MEIRKIRFVANHKHKYILDKNNFGMCKCGATKQFPNEKIQKLRPDERSFMENIGYEVDKEGWTYAKLHGMEKLA